jgi:capsular exopolysaccharide synthesis family protein
VLLVDCDMRKPTAHEVLSLSRGPGLSDLLASKATVEQAIRSVAGSGLHVVTAGASVPSPGDLLTTESMRGLMESLRTRYGWMVLDTPPVGAVADALVLASLGDGVIVVAGAEMVSRKAVLNTLHRVSETGARILGVVLNRAQVARHAYYYGRYYGHYGHYGYHSESRPRASMPTSIQ